MKIYIALILFFFQTSSFALIVPNNHNSLVKDSKVNTTSLTNSSNTMQKELRSAIIILATKMKNMDLKK